MEKNRKKKKAGDAMRKSAKPLTAYKSREAEDKSNVTEATFAKSFGKAKDAPRKA